MKKNFTLQQLFSLVDGRLSTNIGDVYDMLNHICNEDFMTHHLPTALNYVKSKNPQWFQDAQKQVEAITVLCPIKEKTPDQFKWIMGYFMTKDNPTYEVPQLKDEVDTSDLGNYMV